MSADALELVREYAREGALLRETFFREHADTLVTVGRTLAVRLAEGGKIFFCGNGASAALAQHLAGAFINRFQMERPALPAIALTADASVLTAVGNDHGFDQVFARQVKALGKAGDVLVGITPTGNGANVVAALREAKEKKLTTVGMAGKNGEALRFSDLALLVPHTAVAHIQEIHLACGHLLCGLVDHYLFEAVSELAPYLESGAQQGL